MITGTEGPDSLNGTSAAESIYAAGGNDTVHAGLGDDTVDGGAGSDLIYGEGGNDILYGGQDTDADTLLGGDGDDTIVGQSGADSIDGGAGDDAIGIDIGNWVLGGAGDDYLQINDSANRPFVQTTIDGGDGADFVDFFYYRNDVEIWIDQTSTSTSGFELHNIEALGLGAAATVHGGAGADLVFSQGGSALIVGNAGDDTLVGAQGDDSLNGGAGNDVLVTGEGTNKVAGGAGDDVIGLAGWESTVDGGAGFDVVDFSDATQGVVASFSQNLHGWHIINVEAMVGSDFGDTLEGGGGADLILAGAGDDTVHLTRGADSLDGGDGFDWLTFYGSKLDGMVDLVLGQATLSDGSQTELASFEAVYGGDGDDTIKASDGDDQLNGGDGVNTISYEHASAAVRVNLGFQHGSQDTGGSGIDTLDGFSVLIGSNFDDVLTGSAGSTLDGGAGDDTLRAGVGYNLFIGGEGRDTITLADPSPNGVVVDFAAGKITDSWQLIARFSGVEWIVGSDGADTFYSGDGDDGADGGGGANIFSFAHARAGVHFTLAATGAQDTGGAGVDQIVGFNQLEGSAFADQLATGKAKAFAGLTGGGGNDVLDGSAARAGVGLLGDGGNDLLFGSAGDDFLIGGAGTDTVSYAKASSGVTVDLMYHGAVDTGQGQDEFDGIESLIGSKHNDALTGDDGKNRLTGGDGDDTLIGGRGADQLTGGAGVDRFKFLSSEESTKTAHDLITDLTNQDVIDVSAIDADGTGGNGDQAFHLVGAFSGTRGEAVLSYDPGHDRTTLALDMDGDKRPDVLVLIAGDHAGFSNFVL